MSLELVLIILYVSTLALAVCWAIARLKYREDPTKALSARLDALESKRVDITKDDWDAIKSEVSSLRLANGFRVRKQ